jgi:hypothetical protein
MILFFNLLTHPTEWPIGPNPSYCLYCFRELIQLFSSNTKFPPPPSPGQISTLTNWAHSTAAWAYSSPVTVQSFPSKPGGNYMYQIFNNWCICVLPTECIYGFHMILRVNSEYFLKQRQPVDLCNGEVWCFLCGTDWILKYYLDELRLQRVNLECWCILMGKS